MRLRTLFGALAIIAATGVTGGGGYAGIFYGQRQYETSLDTDFPAASGSSLKETR